MKYSEVTPIHLRPAGVWQVIFTNEFPTQLLLVVDKSMPVEEVVQIVKNHHPNRTFEVRQIWAGEFEISTISAYSADGRKVTSDLEVTL